MTQTPRKPSCNTFPKDDLPVFHRPCLRRACGGNRNAGKLLAYLIYQASQEAPEGRKPTEPITIYRTQGQIVTDLDEELCDRTLRDDAVPCLVTLGYLGVAETRGKSQYTAWTIYPAKIQAGINHPEKVPAYETLSYHQTLHGKRHAKWQVLAEARKQFRTETIPNGNNSEVAGSELFPNRSEMLPDGSETIPQSHGIVSEPTNATESTAEEAGEGVFAGPKSVRFFSKIESQESVCGESSESDESDTSQQDTHTSSSSLDWNAFSNQDDDSYSQSSLTTGIDLDELSMIEDEIDEDETIHRMPAINPAGKGQSDASHTLAMGGTAPGDSGRGLPTQPDRRRTSHTGTVQGGGQAGTRAGIDTLSSGASASATARGGQRHADVPVAASRPPGVVSPHATPETPPVRSRATPELPLAAIQLLDNWDREFGASGRPKWVVEAAKDIVSRLKGDIDDVKRVVERMRGMPRYRDKVLNLEMVSNEWGLLTQKPAAPVAPAKATVSNVYSIEAMLARQQARLATRG